VIVTVSLARMFLIVLLLLTPVVCGEAADQKTPAPREAPAPAPPASQVIPLAEVASRATEVEALLRTFEAMGTPGRKIEAIRSELPAENARLGLELQRTLSILRGQPTLEWLEGAQELWVEWQRPMTIWLSELTQWAGQLQENLTRLADEQRRWTQTQDAARATTAPGSTMQRIAGILAAIEQVQKTLEDQRAMVLDLQGRVVEGVSRCQTARAQIAEVQKHVLEGLLVRDHPPLWSRDSWSAWPGGSHGVRAKAADWWEGITLSLRHRAEGLAPTVVFLLVLTVLLWAARRWVDRETATEEAPSLGAAAFDRPLSAATFVTMLVHLIVYGAFRPVVRDVIGVVLLVPTIRLTAPVVDPRVVPGLFMLAALFTYDTVRRVLVGGLVFERPLLALEMLAAILALGYALRSGTLRRPRARAGESERLISLRSGACLALLLCAASLVAVVLGYLRLARLLASGVLGSAYLALLLAAGIRVVTGVATLVFLMWPVRLLGMVERHRDLLERRTHRVLLWFAVGVWIVRSLGYVGLLGPVATLGQSLLTAKVERGALSISVEDVLAFVLTLWVAYLLSAFLRFALEEDVYPRVGLTRGMSYALSSLLNYVLLTLGVLAGLAVLGLDLTKLTIMASAFGVGIGFGLQSVVNNFVSGLILLFERPIHVGDTIEAGGIMGSVRRIGIRSSVVRTWQGAEIIVPNAQLVTDRVTNWTLSDRQRLIELPVGVSYSAHPKKVTEMLEAVAQGHPQVLRQPPPRAFFTGFGDSSINFELRAWTDQFDQWFQIRSELATAVFDASQAAGISFPFPQREVRLLQDPSAPPAAAPPP